MKQHAMTQYKNKNLYENKNLYGGHLQAFSCQSKLELLMCGTQFMVSELTQSVVKLIRYMSTDVNLALVYPVGQGYAHQGPLKC